MLPRDGDTVLPERMADTLMGPGEELDTKSLAGGILGY